MINYLFSFISLFIQPFIGIFYLILFITKNTSIKVVHQKLGLFNYSTYQANKFTDKSLPIETCWFHFASLGEWQTSKFLLYELKKEPFFKNKSFLVTYFNHDLKKIIDKEEKVNYHFLLPFENKWAYKKIIKTFNPILFLNHEVELWPILLCVLSKYNVKKILINAFLYSTDYWIYKRLKFPFLYSMSQYNLICLQKEKDRQFLNSIGIPSFKMCISGNLKLHYITKNKNLIPRKTLGISENDIMIVFGSIHLSEIPYLIELWKNLYQEDKKIIIAPRYLNILKKIYSELNKNQLPFITYSQLNLSNQKKNHIKTVLKIIIVDEYGLLLNFYAMSNQVFIGGTLINHGGHNIIEPISFNKRTIIGSYYKNFKDIVFLFKDYIDIIPKKSKRETAKLIHKTIINNQKKNIKENGQSLLIKNNNNINETKIHILKYLNIH